jgi:hypothetical protein
MLLDDTSWFQQELFVPESRDKLKIEIKYVFARFASLPSISGHTNLFQ